MKDGRISKSANETDRLAAVDDDAGQKKAHLILLKNKTHPSWWNESRKDTTILILKPCASKTLYWSQEKAQNRNVGCALSQTVTAVFSD
mmetsp:Transcript_9753/g.18498  ORF Transcript_9753/g.18498 Transcript_9753/m.18498 type:complete len:89 (+) Transcript_9753:138-404(+)